MTFDFFGRKKAFWIPIAGVGCVFLAAVLWSPGQRNASGEIPASGPVVSVAPLTLSSGYDMESEFLGRVEASRRSLLGFDLGGLLDEVLVREGDRVRKGQILARLDTRRMEAALRESLAGVEAAAADVKLAETELQRVISLTDARVASARERDEAQRVFDATTAKLRAAQAAADRIREDLAKSALVAPYDGAIVERHRDEGSVVGPGAEVLALLETARLRIRAGVVPEVAADWTEGSEVGVRTAHGELPATVESIVPQRERSTRTQTVFLSMPAADLKDGDLVRVVSRRHIDEAGFRMDSRLLVEADRGLWGCYVVTTREGVQRAELRTVEVLHLENEEAFVRGALREGEMLVIAGQQKLVPGVAVRVAPQVATEP